MKVALITEVFPDASSWSRLAFRLGEAARQGSHVAVLPELALNRWAPASKVSQDDDAEPIGGARCQALAAAARQARVAVLGGIIERDRENGRRFNTALLFSGDGEVVGSYRKSHIPQEEGFWEACHYEAGDEPPAVITGLPMNLGVQICSDANRPEGTHVLTALGAGLVVVPRATPTETYERWRLVLRANAITSTCFVISVNRPGPELGVGIGGPSLAIAPSGEVLVETTEAMAVVTLEAGALVAARKDYPGYLDVRADLYRDGWQRVCDGGRPEAP